jgi:AcrR family transcriptional regulator
MTTRKDPALELPKAEEPGPDVEKTRAKVQRIALELFLEKGYQSTTTRDVALAVGVQQPSLYNHIKNKEELLHGICYPSFLRLIEAAEAAVAQAGSPIEKVRQLSHVHLTVTLKYQREFSVSVMECRALSEEYRAEIDALWKRYSATIYAVLDAAKEEKAIRTDIDNRYLYTAMMDMLNWSVLWYRPGSALSIADLDRVFISIYLDGALSRRDRSCWKPADLYKDNSALLASVIAPPQFALKESHVRLLDAACTLFARKGYFGTSMREIAELTGLQKATLYHYVSSKEDIIYQISKAALEHIRAGVNRGLAGLTDPLQRVHMLICTHVLCLLEHKNWHAAANDELHALSPARRAEIVALRDDYESILRCVFQEAQDAGYLRSDIPAKILGLVVLGMINCIYPWYSPEKDLLPAELGHTLSDLFLRGAGVDAQAS